MGLEHLLQPKNYDRTGPRTGLGMADLDYQTGASITRPARSNEMAPNPPNSPEQSAPKFDWDPILGLRLSDRFAVSPCR